MSNSSIWPIDRTLSGAIILGQRRPGSNSNEGVLCIPQSSSITGALPSDYLVSYPGYSLGESYPSAEMLLKYYSADWINRLMERSSCRMIVCVHGKTESICIYSREEGTFLLCFLGVNLHLQMLKQQFLKKKKKGKKCLRENETLTSITTPDERGSGDNDHENGTPHKPELLNLILTTKFSLSSYQRYQE